MKKLLLSCSACLAVVSAQAQWLFNPDSVMGAGLGAMIGGVSGGNCHNGGFSGNDAAIGAGIGLLAGTVLGEARRQSAADAGYAYAPAPPANVTFGYGYGNCGSSAYVYYSPNYYTAPGYYYQPTPQPAVQAAPQPQRPNYAVGGTLLGAASGALIGSGIHNQTWEGAAIGAGAGLVLGSTAEYATRKQEQKNSRVQTVAQYQRRQRQRQRRRRCRQNRKARSPRRLAQPRPISGPRRPRKSPTLRASRMRRGFEVMAIASHL